MLVAVYGTLRKGFHNHVLLEGSKFLGETKTEPKFNMYGNLIPWITNNGDTSIAIEVYEVEEETFQRLDWLEGYPNYYDRQVIDTEFGEAWIYFRWYTAAENKISSGDWKKFQKSRYTYDVEDRPLESLE